MTIFAVRNNPSMKNDNTFSLSGQIIDLVHSRIFPGRITVNDSKITEIEELPVAEQRYIMPGFIDVHTHSDWEVLRNPRREAALRQGITTEASMSKSCSLKSGRR